MAAYLISDITVHDRTAFEVYRTRAADAIRTYGGRYLARLGEVQVLEGSWNPDMIVIAEFPNLEQARAWYRSPEYAFALEVRDEALSRKLILVDGVNQQAERERNKALVLQAFDTLFNKRDYAAAERFWSPNYIQHSAHIAPGREGLFDLVKSLPPTLKYESGTIVAEGSYVIVHGRFSGFGQPVNWIAADIVRIKDGVLVEHWDVIEDEASRQESKSGLPMFGDSFSK